MAKGLPSTSLYRSQDEERLYLKSNIDGWFFDGFISISQTHTLTVTSHPVQSGANISDHAYEDPISIKASIIVSDAYTADDTKRDAQLFLSNGVTKSIGAFNVLRQMQSERRLLKVVTKYGSYNNMLLTSISVNTEYKNLYNMIADVELEEVIIASEKTVKVSSRNQTTGTSSPDPSMNAYTSAQEDQAKAEAGQALDDASESENSGVTKTKVNMTVYEGDVDNLKTALRRQNYLSGTSSQSGGRSYSGGGSRLKNKSTSVMLGVFTTKKTNESEFTTNVDSNALEYTVRLTSGGQR